MSRASVSLLLLTLLWFLHPSSAGAQGPGEYHHVEYAASADAGALQLGVRYTYWIPPVERLRGVIVHQHGCGTGACQGGETAAFDLHWQALARKWDCALLGPSYRQQEGQNCRLWCDPRNGSRDTFLRSLQEVGQASGHPELAEIPWCLWGHSGGGFWASLMQVSDPERIVAIWLRSGTALTAWERGEIPKPEIPGAAYRIPTICNPGAKENGDARFAGAWDGALAMFRAYRAQDALIGVAPDPQSSHDCGVSRYVAIPFFDTCLAARLPEPGAAAALRPMPTDSAWLGELLGHEAHPAAEHQGERAESVWLPNAEFARVWSEYVQDGMVKDATPPPAPTHVVVGAAPGGGSRIRWEVEADLESGLAGFVVLRDGEEWRRLPERVEARIGRPQFQRMSYHDTPEAPLPELSIIDLDSAPGAHEYSVIALNTAGLRSAPTAALAAVPRVLYIGIDGTRFDAIERADTPQLDALIADGCHSRTCLILGDRYRGNDTVSGPGWSSILTGVWADKHGAQDNNFQGTKYDEYPHLFVRLKETRPDARTASFVTWAPIHDKITAGADVSVNFEESAHGVLDYDRYDIAATDAAVRELTEQNPDVVFLYLGQVDVAGHTHGFHPSVPEYVAAIERADRLVGRAVAAVRSRPQYRAEDWLVVVTSDHGGLGKGHGGGHDKPEILNSFLIVSGPAARRGAIEEQVFLVDAPVTVLGHLGVAPREAWRLDGRSILGAK